MSWSTGGFNGSLSVLGTCGPFASCSAGPNDPFEISGSFETPRYFQPIGFIIFSATLDPVVLLDPGVSFDLLAAFKPLPPFDPASNYIYTQCCRITTWPHQPN